jgi:hypothetical protein
MTITAPPDPPDIDDPENFATKAQAFVEWLVTFRDELDAIIGQTIPAGSAAAGTLTGGTLAANVLASSLTSLGTLAALVLGTGAKYTSAAQTITAAGSLTLAHGLSAIPTMFEARLKCISAEGNYSVNDEVVQYLGGENSDVGVSVVADATNLNVRFGSAANTFIINNKTTGGGLSIDNSKWQIIFRAWVL